MLTHYVPLKQLFSTISVALSFLKQNIVNKIIALVITLKIFLFHFWNAAQKHYYKS